MSVLVYNGVTLSYIATNEIAFEPVKDDTSGVDTLYTHVTIDVDAVIAYNLAPNSGGETATETAARIQHLLMTPRKPLSFTVGGANLVSVASPPDAKNGPEPQFCRVRRIMDTNNLHVHYRVEAWIVDCTDNPQRLPWVSHRWTETIDLNRHAMTRRTRVGKIITRSDILGNNPDALRGLVAPALEPEFVRMESSYTLQADGLALTYRFVDEEQFLQVPNPASEAVGQYIESTGDGAIRYGECRLLLRGGKPTDKGVLLSRCIAIVMAKLLGANPQQDRGQALATGYIREDLYRNEVEVLMRVMLKNLTGVVLGPGGASDKFGKVNQDLKRFGSRPLGSEKGVAPFDPGVYGTAQLGMIAAALRDPCLVAAFATLRTGQYPNTPTPRGTTVPATVTISALLPPPTTQSSEPGVYQTYRVSIRTMRNENKLQLPVGKAGSPAAIIRTAPATAMRTVNWTAEKTGSQPFVPDPQPKDSNLVLLASHVDPTQIDVTADGVTPKYTVTGRYEYAFKDAEKVKIAAAVPPWVDPSAANAAVVPFTFKAGIIDLDAGFASASLTTTGAGAGRLENG